MEPAVPQEINEAGVGVFGGPANNNNIVAENIINPHHHHPNNAGQQQANFQMAPDWEERLSWEVTVF